MSAQPTAGDWGERQQRLADLLDITIDRGLLERALTHRSFAYENGGLPTNERLEFLGDSVLGLVVTDTLFRGHPDLPEGQLAKLRAAVVNMRALADVGRGLSHRRVRPARPRRGVHRRPGQVLDPRRHPRGAARRRLPRPGPGGRRRAGAPAVRPADRRGRARSAPAWTGRPACRSSPPPPRSAYRSTSSRRPGPTTRRRSPPSSGSAASAYGEGSGRSKKEAEQQAAETAWRHLRAGLPDDGGADRRYRPDECQPMPELPEVEVVRRGLAALGRRPHRRRRSTSPTPGPYAGTSAGRPTSPGGWPAAPSPAPAAAASTCGCRWTATATPCSPTSA